MRIASQPARVHRNSIDFGCEEYRELEPCGKSRIGEEALQKPKPDVTAATVSNRRLVGSSIDAERECGGQTERRCNFEARAPVREIDNAPGQSLQRWQEDERRRVSLSPGRSAAL